MVGWSRCAAMFLGLAMTSWAASGFAVSVSYNSSDMTNWGYWRGSLVRYKISNNSVTSRDTLHSKVDGYAYYPATNLAGTKVAFYRFGNPSSIAAVDLATRQVEDLCELPANPARQQALDWPAGDWIYYVIPQSQSGGDPEMQENVDIWRVNAVTGVNEQYVYINDGRVPMPGIESGWGPVFPCYIRRFTMSLDGTRAAIQGVNWGWNCNSVYCFPPPGGNVRSPGCHVGGAGSCNISLSCSGGYCGGYGATAHDKVEMSRLSGAVGPQAAPPLLSEIESWLGENVGQGGECIRWAQNSDKWVLQQIGWEGHAGAIQRGSNQIIANWVDHEAIRTSQNPQGLSLCSSTGDFWVDGGAQNAGKYEGADGVWRTPDVSTGTPEHGETKDTPARDRPNVSGVGIVNLSAGGKSACRGYGDAYNLRGEKVGKSLMTGVVVVTDR